MMSLLPAMIMASQPAAAAVYTTQSNGDWQNSCTWFVCPPGGIGYPGPGDTAFVKHYVTFGAQQGVDTLVLTGSVEVVTLDILNSGVWNSGTFEAGVYNIGKTLEITHVGPIGIMNLHGTLNNPINSSISQNSTYQMHNAGTVNNHGYYGISNDSDIGNSVALGPVINNHSTGVFEKAGGTATSSISGNIDFNNQGGTISAKAGTLQIGKLTGNSGLLKADAGATIQLVGTNLAGTYTGSGGGTVELSSGFEGTATFDMPGALLNWTNGSIKGVLTNVGTLGITGGSVPFLTGTIHNGTVVGTGVINQSGRYSMTNDGVLNNKETYNLVNDDASITNSVGGAPKINNQGSFVKTGGTGKSSVAANIEFNNQGGTIAAQTGTLEIGKLTGNGGVLNAATGATIRIQGTDLAGIYTGSGDGTVELNGGFVGAATFEMPGNLLKWTGGNITGALVNASSLGIAPGAGRLTGGSIVNVGLITQSATFYMSSDITLLENRGTYLVINDSDISNGVSGIPVFKNTEGGSYAKTAGTGTSSISGIAFDNAGEVSVRSGTLSLSNVVQHPTGSTALTGGSWVVMAGSTLDIASGGNIVTNQAYVSLNGAGSTFAKFNALADNQGGFALLAGRDFTTASNLLNSGTLTVGQGSTLTLKNNGTLTSSGTIRGGGSIIGNVVSSGLTAPGMSVGTLSLDGNLMLESVAGDGSVLAFEIADASSFDRLTVSGSVALAGALKVDLLPGFAPKVGDSFQLMTFASFSGNFDAYQLPALGAGLYLQPVLHAGNLTLTVAVPEPQTYAMLLMGLGVVGWRLRRRRMPGLAHGR